MSSPKSHGYRLREEGDEGKQHYRIDYRVNDRGEETYFKATPVEENDTTVYKWATYVRDEENADDSGITRK